MTTTYTFPDENCDPQKKDFDWILQYVRAAYSNSNTYCGGSLYFNRVRMQEISDYVRGQLTKEKRKRLFLGGEGVSETWNDIDIDDYPDFLSKYRNIAVAKILQRQYDTQCFAVDALSKSEEDKHFTEMKVKIMMREIAEKMQSELSGSPELKPSPNEPQDIEQLKIEESFGYKHVLSMEAEEGIELIKQQNDIAERRKRTVENLVDFGIGGYTEWIDENGQCKFEELVPSELITSYCSKNDFSDMSYWGRVIEVRVADLVPYFKPDQIKVICESYKGKQGNPKLVNTGTDSYWNAFKVFVLDLKLLTYDTSAYEERVDKDGNLRVGKTEYKNIFKKKEPDTSNQGAKEPIYTGSTKQVVYKTKWIIDSDMMYDWGKSENQVRKQSSWWKTDLDVQLYSWSFDRMKFSGLTEKLIPLQNEAARIWHKLQNLSNKLIPYLINLDMNAVENNGFGEGGKMKPSEVVDFIFSNYIVPYRSSSLLNSNPNYKPVSIEATGQLTVFQQYYANLQSTIEQMRQVSGLNEYTDGSTVNAKNLNSTNEGMNASTNNALYLIMNADKHLIHKLDEAIILKIQIAVKLGKVSGYVRALGSETVKFLEINPDISLREFGIFVEEAPTQQQREMIWQEINLKESQGLLDVTDKVLIMSARNIKKAMMVLSYRIKKRKEEQQQFELAKIQENNQGQQQMLAMQSQLQQQTYQMQLQGDLIRIQTEKQWEYQIAAMSKQVDFDSARVQAEGRNIGHTIQSEAKLLAAQVAAGATIDKQIISNMKPQPKKATA